MAWRFCESGRTDDCRVLVLGISRRGRSRRRIPNFPGFVAGIRAKMFRGRILHSCRRRRPSISEQGSRASFLFLAAIGIGKGEAGPEIRIHFPLVRNAALRGKLLFLSRHFYDANFRVAFATFIFAIATFTGEKPNRRQVGSDDDGVYATRTGFL